MVTAVHKASRAIIARMATARQRRQPHSMGYRYGSGRVEGGMVSFAISREFSIRQKVTGAR